MSPVADFIGKTCLVTGASSGIGKEFARIMAKNGAHLVITGRSKKRLMDVSGELRSQHGVNRNIEVVVIDLADPETPQKLFDHLQKVKVHVDVLVNNAGFGDWGYFEDADYDKIMKMNVVNMVNVASMCRLFIPPMLEKGGGGIINVASAAGFQPVPYMANYAASKAFVLNLSLALWQEYFERGITVTALCPGWTKTGFLETAGVQESKVKNMIEPRQVVFEALAAFIEGDPLIIPKEHRDFLQFTISKFLPLKHKLDIAAGMFKPDYKPGEKDLPREDEEEKSGDKDKEKDKKEEKSDEVKK